MKKAWDMPFLSKNNFDWRRIGQKFTLKKQIACLLSILEVGECRCKYVHSFAGISWTHGTVSHIWDSEINNGFMHILSAFQYCISLKSIDN